MGVQDRDWWKEAHRKATHDSKQFRKPAEPRASDPLYPDNRPRASLPFGLKVATVVLLFIAAVVACLHKSRLI